MIDLSVVIIALNEESRLGRCLASLPKGVEVVVLDSGSIDGTLQIAANHNARTAIRAFDDYASQKNAALALASRAWIFSLDADEVLSPELSRELVQFVESAEAKNSKDAFRVRRRLSFMGRIMRFGKTSDRPIRLFPRDGGRFHSKIHEQYRPDYGSIRPAQFHESAYILHFSYENLTDYFDKFNRYTSRIAEQHKPGDLDSINFMAHVVRPFFEFGTRYVLRLGFLDGYPGYCYAMLSSLYAFVKYAKVAERTLK